MRPKLSYRVGEPLHRRGTTESARAALGRAVARGDATFAAEARAVLARWD